MAASFDNKASTGIIVISKGASGSSIFGAHGWQLMSYSPATGLVYMPY